MNDTVYVCVQFLIIISSQITAKKNDHKLNARKITQHATDNKRTRTCLLTDGQTERLCEEAMSLSQSSQGNLPLLWDFDRWDSGQSPVHFSLPTAQINTSLVFSAVRPQHHLPLPTPGLLDTEDFHNPLVSHHCSTMLDSVCVLLLCHTNTCLLLLFVL